MKKSLTIGIIVLLLVLVGVVLLYFFSFRQREKRLTESSVQDRIKYNSAVKALAMEKKNLKSLAASLGINYFSRWPESSQMDTSFFMFNRISALANKWGVQVIGFSPAEKEEKGGFTKISFVGEVSAAYLDLVQFFRELEENEKLFIDNVKITATSISPLKHRVQFELSCLEFSDKLLQNLKGAEPVSTPSNSPKTIFETVRRDPFLNAFEDTHVSPPGKKAQGGVVGLSKELSLTGISSFPEPRTAIIDHKVVKKGDRINGREVVDIKKDRVILKRGEQTYTLRLQAIPPQKTNEGNL